MPRSIGGLGGGDQDGDRRHTRKSGAAKLRMAGSRKANGSRTFSHSKQSADFMDQYAHYETNDTSDVGATLAFSVTFMLLRNGVPSAWSRDRSENE